jgi:hypothetical protein
MTSRRSERVDWEYADGREVGRDVPVTSPPREEEAPGVPAPLDPGSGTDGSSRPLDGGSGAVRERSGATEERSGATQEREVKAEDPELSPETNARVTQELREVVGTDRVEVPVDQPRASRGARAPEERGLAYLSMHRLQLLRGLLIVLTFGAIISLITNDWWLLLVAAGIHAFGTMTVTLTTIRMTTVTEHPSPEVAAAMSEEGIRSPDERFSKMVDEFRGHDSGGTQEVITPGHNENTADPTVDAAEASGQQATAMTPSGEPTRPGGQKATPDLVIWTTVFSLLVLSIVLPAVGGGGWLWLLTAVMVPLIAAWSALQLMLAAGKAPSPERRRATLVTIALGTAVAVAAFCAIVAFAFQH